jgi:hypothetical protein
VLKEDPSQANLYFRNDPFVGHPAHSFWPIGTDIAQQQSAEHRINQQHSKNMVPSSSHLGDIYQNGQAPVNSTGDGGYPANFVGEHRIAEANMATSEANIFELKDIDPDIFRMLTGESLTPIEETSNGFVNAMITNDDIEMKGSPESYAAMLDDSVDPTVPPGIWNPIMPRNELDIKFGVSDLMTPFEDWNMARQGTSSVRDHNSLGSLNYPSSDSSYGFPGTVLNRESFRDEFGGVELMCGPPDVAGRATRSESSASGSGPTNVNFLVPQVRVPDLRQSALLADQMGIATSQPERGDDVEDVEADMIDGKNLNLSL